MEKKKVKFSLTRYTKKGSFRFSSYIYIQKTKYMKIALEIAIKYLANQMNTKAVFINLKTLNLKTIKVISLNLKLKSIMTYGLEFWIKGEQNAN